MNTTDILTAYDTRPVEWHIVFRAMADWRNDTLVQLVHKVVDEVNTISRRGIWDKDTGEVEPVDSVRQFRGVNAIVRPDGSVSIYTLVGSAHNVLYDTLDASTVDVNQLAVHAASVLILAFAKRGDISGAFDPAWMSTPIADAIQTALTSQHTELLARNASLVNVCNERLARMERAEAQLQDLLTTLAAIRDKADEVRNDAVAATDATLAVLDEAKRR